MNNRFYGMHYSANSLNTKCGICQLIIPKNQTCMAVYTGSNMAKLCHTLCVIEQCQTNLKLALELFNKSGKRGFNSIYTNDRGIKRSIIGL